MRDDVVAIVGIGCRFPGSVADTESFWSLLADGRSGIREVPPDRWSLDRYYHPDAGASAAMTTKWGGFVDHLDTFDARFWGISPREAMRMDPQQRWLLEVAWEAIEDAGIAPPRLRGRPIGVFVGVAGNDYGGLQLSNLKDVDAYTNSGSTLSIASNRVSYMFDFTGPSLSVDTACSSAAVAVSLACQNLALGTCQAALVGGVNALITPHASVGFSKASMLSPSGQCFAFDARANGYVRGEGAGVVFLKPLRAALADGDRIYAVIRATAVNQDGHTSSMSVPSADGQAAMLREAYARAGVAPSSVSYVEAHGTGTPVGDPIEARALGCVLREGRADDRPCLIGSVKTNIGHLEAGAGIAGLIKAALVLQRRTIPPSLNFREPNPHIPFAELRLAVATRLQPLPPVDGRLPVVAVNSFGFGGTNAHVVLEAAPTRATAAPPARPAADRPRLLAISARDETALQRYVGAYRDVLDDPSPPLEDLCAAAGERKAHHERRLAAIGHSHQQLRRRLAAWLRDGTASDVVSGRAAPGPPPVFVFSGQGTQWAGMGRQLREREPVFRQSLDAIDARFRALAGWSLVDEMLRSGADSRIDRTDVAQPAIFAVQAGLAELWKTWGLRPAAVIGHSVGEVAAAYYAGVLDLDDAVTVIFHRSRLQHTTAGDGRMLAVGLSPDRAREAIDGEAGHVELAGINSPHLVTLSGGAEALERLAAQLARSGVFTRWLRIQYAFHSRRMDPIRHELQHALRDIRPGPPRITFVSTVTGTPIGHEPLDGGYWWENVRRPVLFEPAIGALLREGAATFLEIGPHPALESSLKECLDEHKHPGAVFHSLRRDEDESHALFTSLAAMHVRGVSIDFRAVNQSRGPIVRLPHYPWSRESYWLESRDSAHARLTPPMHPLLGQRLAAALPTWQITLDLHRLTYLRDHRVWDTVIFPAAGYGEIGLSLGRLLFPDERHAVDDLQIAKALFVDEAQPSTIQVVYHPEGKSFAVYSASRETDAWELHARGTLTPVAPGDVAPADVAAIRAALGEHFDHDQYCREFAVRGYQYGEAFHLVRNIWRVRGEALAEIDAPPSVADAAGEYAFHPALQDACLQAFIGTRAAAASAVGEDLFLPQSIRRLRLYRERPPSRLWAHARLRDDDGASLVADILVYDDAGRRVADILGLRLDRVERKRAGDDDWCYRFEWEPRRLRGSGVGGPCSLAPAADIAAAVGAVLPDIRGRHALDRYYRDHVPRIKAAICELIGRGFAELGWTPAPGDTVHFASLIESLGIVEQHHRVTRNLLHDLARQGWLSPAGPDVWTVLRPPPPSDVSATLRALAADVPAVAAEIDLLARTGPNLAEVLRGELDPMTVLFPGGSHEPLERFYAEAAAFPAHLELLSRVVAKAIEALPSRRALRVLEVGAGTAALTRALLPVLPADRTDYLFTDISPAFLAAARRRLGDYPWVDYHTFDIEQDPAGQGIAPGSFDVVVAADVLHATADLRRTLSHLRACLTDGGLLVFLEPVARDVVRDNIVFGLLKGWWRFTDTDLRPDSPLLDRGAWEALLVRSGFRDVASLACAPDGQEAEHATLLGFAAPRDTGSASAPASAARGGRYVIFADAQGVADALDDRLRALGHETLLVRRPDGADHDDAPGVRAALASEDLAGVIHCRSLDHPPATHLDGEQLQAVQQTGVLSALRVVRALLGRATRVWFVARGVHRVDDGDRVEGLAAAPLVGLIRVANNETDCRLSLVDLEACAPDEAAAQLLAEVVTAPDGDLEVAYRGGMRHAPRLRRVRADQLPVRTANAVRTRGAVVPFRLQTDRPGVLTNLALHETERRAPGPGELEVRVHAAGINFRDVMKALGTYPGQPPDALWLGDDFAGIVERLGDGVHHLRPGDAVAGMAPAAFGAYAVTDARMAFTIPTGMSFADAATLPTAFLTAHYALHDLARMQRGERVLVHAGAGGVGQAAIQIARHLGLEIFATAGTPEKRRILREQGVHHVMRSRTLDFADEIMEVTGGRGVDAVLNSLAGPFLLKSLAVLAPFGRFVEIGKVDIYQNAKLGLLALRNNVSYFVLDLVQHLQERPDLVGRLFATLGDRVAAGVYRPLPSTAFPITQAAEAFRFMAQAKHVGKNVLRFDVEPIPIGPCTDEAARFRADASYLVTGGAGGFGLEVAKWMAGHGAGHLVLMSRSGPREARAQRAIDDLRAAGVTVVDARGDVTRAEDVQRVVREIRAQGPPLRGVVHAAMVLDDESLALLDEPRFCRVLAPKMAGAFNLHRATLDCELEHFVCFSSFSAVAGGPRQSAYNAGNAFLQALAHHRRAAGLPALTVDWGAIAGAGFVERNQKTLEYLQKIGFETLAVADALRVLGRLLLRDAPQVVVARVDWQRLSGLATLVGSSPAYAAVARERRAAEHSGSLSARLRAMRPGERTRLVEDFIVDQVAAVFGMAATQIDRDAPLTTLGLDSLMTVELIHRVEHELGLRMPMGTLLGGPTATQLAQAVLRLLGPMLDAGDDAPSPAATTAAAASPAAPSPPDSRHVVPLRAGADGPPLIAFHPVGGSIGLYASLVRHLPGDVPVYGIESRLMRGADREFDDLDTMVTAYVAAVRDTTRGPYRLFGFSLGGYLAARVAQVLEQEHEAVEFVGVIEWDTRPRLTKDAQRDALLRLGVATYRFLAEDMNAVRALPPERLHADFGRLAAHVVSEPRADVFLQWALEHDLIVSDPLRAWAGRYLAAFGQHCLMLAADLPQPRFRAPLVVWRATDGLGSAVESWRHAGEVAIEHVAAGDHFAFVRPPAVVTLANQMDAFLHRPGVETPSAARAQ
jgi:acyl transferase domain-containing protein/NADPH:quinone reductase-like Zn-dependent oxidoreductase/thioesterase domain-containing protein/SAM-dependent methyltransferase/acyl carrier protein